MGIGRRFSTPWRPMDLGKGERIHRETQKVVGMLVTDIMNCLPAESGELHHVLEFVIYNTSFRISIIKFDAAQKTTLI